jgi:hypothetical protein
MLLVSRWLFLLLGLRLVQLCMVVCVEARAMVLMTAGLLARLPS